MIAGDVEGADLMNHSVSGEPLPKLVRPVAVFDAGIGSYAAVAAIRRLLPEQDIPYFADRASFPYGGKGRAELLAILRRTLRYLDGFDPAAILVASNAPSITVLDDLAGVSPAPLFGVRPPVAAAVGHVPRGEALIARMDRELAALPKSANAGVAAYYQRRGYMTGTGTLIDDVMTRTGLTNLAARLDKPALSQLSLEEMVAARPDYLIVESATDRVTDQGTEMLHHPALKDIPRLSIPQAWTVCGGPAYVQAARGITDQIAARRR